MGGRVARTIRVAAAQMGPNQKADSREDILARMTRLLEDAAAQRATLVVFPELAFTAWPWLRPGGDAGDLGTNLKGLAPSGSILDGWKLVAAEQEEVVDSDGAPALAASSWCVRRPVVS